MKLSSLKPKRCLIFLKKNLHTFRDDCCSIFKIKNPTYSRRAADHKRLTSGIYIYIYIYIKGTSTIYIEGTSTILF